MKQIDIRDELNTYEFYLENCVDEDKGEIPLNREEWNREHGNLI